MIEAMRTGTGEELWSEHLWAGCCCGAPRFAVSPDGRRFVRWGLHPGREDDPRQAVLVTQTGALVRGLDALAVANDEGSAAWMADGSLLLVRVDGAGGVLVLDGDTYAKRGALALDGGR
jgi:hypothetical protein